MGAGKGTPLTAPHYARSQRAARVAAERAPLCGVCGKPSTEVQKRTTGIFLFVCFPCKRVVG